MWASPIMQSIAWLNSFDKRRREYKRLGWVYVARNPCFADPVFKVGQTKVSPVSRVDKLSGSTSVYRPFELVYFVHVSDRDGCQWPSKSAHFWPLKSAQLASVPAEGTKRPERGPMPGSGWPS